MLMLLMLAPDYSNWSAALQVLEHLLAALAAHLPLILRVADNVAMLDMLLAFAEVRSCT